MKKFFKKVSLVLAFALVLGSADHVTVAKAAETWKFQSSAETLYLGSKTAGADTYDFNFVGAPAGYTTNNTFAWVSSDPKVATVAAGGVVTAVADGKTTITCRITNKTTGNLTATATANVTVRTIEHATKVEVYKAGDATQTAITSVDLTVGEKVDLNRKLTNAAGVTSAAGQATNTASTDKTAFAVADDKIATVDPSTGVVTAVKAGTTKVTAYTYDVTDKAQARIKSVDVTINVAADASFTVAQTAVDAFTITFVNEFQFDAKKLEVYKQFEDTEFVHIVKSATPDSKDSKKVVVKSYVDFDEEVTTYRVVYDGIEQKFNASVGTPVTVEIKTELNEDEVYIYNEDIPSSQVTKYTAKLFDANGIDVTGMHDISDGFSFEVSDEEIFTFDEDDMTFYFEETVAAGTSVTLTGEFELSSEESIPVYAVLYAKEAPAQRIKSMKAYYVEKNAANTPAVNTNVEGDQWDNDAVIILNDEKAEAGKKSFLHVALVDNYNNTIYSQYEDTDRVNGTVTFASANTNKLLVDEETGEIKTIATGSGIPVVVYWTPSIDNAKRKAYAYVFVTIKAARTVNKVEATPATPIISNKAAYTGADSTVVTITIKDQEGDGFDPNKVRVYPTNSKAAVTTSASAPLTPAKKLDKDGVAIPGTYTVTISGSSFKGTLDAGKTTDVQYGVYVNGSTTPSATFKITFADPTVTSTTKIVVEVADVDYKFSTSSSLLGANAASTLGTTINVFLTTKNGVKLQKLDYVYACPSDEIVAHVINTVSDTVSNNTLAFYKVKSGSSYVVDKKYAQTEVSTGDNKATILSLTDARLVLMKDGTTVAGAANSLYVREVYGAGSYTVEVYQAKEGSTKLQTKAVATKAFKITNSTGSLDYVATNAELEDITASSINDAIFELYTFKYTLGTDVVELNDKDGWNSTAIKNNIVMTPVYKIVGTYLYVDSVTITYAPTAQGDAIQKKFTIQKTYPIKVSEK